MLLCPGGAEATRREAGMGWKSHMHWPHCAIWGQCSLRVLGKHTGPMLYSVLTKGNDVKLLPHLSLRIYSLKASVMHSLLKRAFVIKLKADVIIGIRSQDSKVCTIVCIKIYSKCIIPYFISEKKNLFMYGWDLKV